MLEFLAPDISCAPVVLVRFTLFRVGALKIFLLPGVPTGGRFYR